jgi:hypothetical protein
MPIQKHTEKSVGYLNNHLLDASTAPAKMPLLIENLCYSTRPYYNLQILLKYAVASGVKKIADLPKSIKKFNSAEEI